MFLQASCVFLTAPVLAPAPKAPLTLGKKKYLLSDSVLYGQPRAEPSVRESISQSNNGFGGNNLEGIIQDYKGRCGLYPRPLVYPTPPKSSESHFRIETLRKERSGVG